jgi:hypothetical protein
MVSYLLVASWWLCIAAPCTAFRATLPPFSLGRGVGARQRAGRDGSSRETGVGSYQLGAQRDICLGQDSSPPLQKNLAFYANAVSNDVLNKMIVSYEPAIEQLKGDFSRFDFEASSVWDKSLQSRSGDSNEDPTDEALVQTQAYLKVLQSIVDGRRSVDSNNILGGYDAATTRFLKYLEEATALAPEEDICLSILDGISDKDSATRSLNTLSNCVVRAMKFCDFKGRASLADSVEYSLGHRGNFPRGGVQPQTCFYVQGLISLLREGKSATEALITFPGPLSSKKAGTSEIFSYIPGKSAQQFKKPPRLRLVEPYRHVMYRIFELSQPDKNQYR